MSLRLKYANFITDAPTDPADPLYNVLPTLAASSENNALPVQNLRDHRITKVWRSGQYWTISITPGFENFRINFTEGGVARVASVAAGTYITGTLMASAVQTAMSAAAVTNTYTVTYSTSTRKFTIARSGGAAAFEIQWATGADKYRSIGPSIGYSDAADDTGATTYTSDFASRTGRRFVGVDLGSAKIPTYCEVIGHNLTSAGTIRIQSSSSSSFTSLTLDQTLSPSASGLTRVGYFVTTARQYWRLVVDDIDNPAGFAELGYWGLGTYVEAAQNISRAFTRELVHLSSVTTAMDGAHHRDQRPARWSFGVSWAGLSDANRAVLEALFQAAPHGRAFFIDFNVAALDSWFVFLAQEQSETFVGRANWNIGTPLLQVIG